MRENQLRPSSYTPTEQEIHDAFFRDFYKESKVNNPDPNSGFHPNNAISNSGEAFQALNSPETQKIKKKIYVSGYNVELYKQMEEYKQYYTFQKLINLGFEVFFVCDDEILKLESITDDKIKFSNNKLGKINNYSINIISYNENKIKKLENHSKLKIDEIQTYRIHSPISNNSSKKYVGLLFNNNYDTSTEITDSKDSINFIRLRKNNNIINY